jgi:hypothetical protein
MISAQSIQEQFCWLFLPPFTFLTSLWLQAAAKLLPYLFIDTSRLNHAVSALLIPIPCSSIPTEPQIADRTRDTPNSHRVNWRDCRHPRITFTAA